MAETMKFKIRAVLEIAAALKRLDGVVRGREPEPFEFAPKVIWNLAKNGTIFDREVEVYNKALRAAAAEAKIYEGDSLSPANAHKFAGYKDKLEEMKDQDVEVPGVLTIKLSDLLGRPASTASKIKTNPIPASVLTGLMPIIEEDSVPSG